MFSEGNVLSAHELIKFHTWSYSTIQSQVAGFIHFIIWRVSPTAYVVPRLHVAWYSRYFFLNHIIFPFVVITRWYHYFSCRWKNSSWRWMNHISITLKIYSIFIEVQRMSENYLARGSKIKILHSRNKLPKSNDTSKYHIALFQTTIFGIKTCFWTFEWIFCCQMISFCWTLFLIRRNHLEWPYSFKCHSKQTDAWIDIYLAYARLLRILCEITDLAQIMSYNTISLQTLNYVNYVNFSEFT